MSLFDIFYLQLYAHAKESSLVDGDGFDGIHKNLLAFHTDLKLITSGIHVGANAGNSNVNVRAGQSTIRELLHFVGLRKRTGLQSRQRAIGSGGSDPDLSAAQLIQRALIFYGMLNTATGFIDVGTNLCQPIEAFLSY